MTRGPPATEPCCLLPRTPSPALTLHPSLQRNQCLGQSGAMADAGNHSLSSTWGWRCCRGSCSLLCHPAYCISVLGGILPISGPSGVHVLFLILFFCFCCFSMSPGLAPHPTAGHFSLHRQHSRLPHSPHLPTIPSPALRERQWSSLEKSLRFRPLRL